MAHFAQIDENNVVVNVSVVANQDILDQDGNESEEKGIFFLKSIYGANTNWVQTSYNGNFRGRYAMIGGTYNAELDVFLTPNFYPSWVLDKNLKTWQPPIPKPEAPHGYNAIWYEPDQEWSFHIDRSVSE
jgi:hypothetical protein